MDQNQAENSHPFSKTLFAVHFLWTIYTQVIAFSFIKRSVYLASLVRIGSSVPETVVPAQYKPSLLSDLLNQFKPSDTPCPTPSINDPVTSGKLNYKTYALKQTHVWVFESQGGG